MGVSSLLDSAGSVGVHRVTLTGLTPNTTYYFQVHSVDNDGNEGTSKLDTDGYTFTTLSGPSISNVAESNILNRTVTITWNTDQASDSYVYYSTSSTVASSTLAGTADNTTSHSVTLQNLTPNTTYYFYVKSGVAEDKNVIDGVITYYNFKTTNDATNPTITFNPSTDVIASDTTLNISWTTDESATSSLEYGTSNAYGSISLNNNYNTNHTYTLTGLLPGTAYYLRIKNTDVNGNGSSATEFTATTTNSADVTPPVITFSAASDVAVSDNAVVVSWITNEIATSTLEYGTSTNYGLISANSNYNQNHSYRVSGLNSGTLYYFRIRSTDTSHNISSPIAFSTTTTNSADITPPSIVFDPNTDVTISSTTVSVTWATNEVATSSLEYGTSNSYGSISVNNNYNTDHSYTISGLTPGTLYYFRLKNADVSYNISSSTTFSTTTVSYSTDTTPPVITSVSTTAVTDDQVFIAWNTDEGATSQVYYGTTSSTYDFSSELDSTLNFTHGIVLSNLVSSTAYSYIVVSHDSSGNSSTSSEYSFMTLEKLSQESEVQLREEIARQTGVTQGQASVSSGGGGGSSIDRTAPVISGVTIPTILSDSAIIKWDTSEEANAIAEFGKTLKYGQASVDLENATKHSISLVELLPFTTYFYRLSSIDTTGNRSTYATGSFTTLSLEQEIASSTENSVEQPTSTAQEPDKASEDIFLSTIEKAGEILKTLANRVSVGVLESSLLGQQKIIEQLSSILPLPIIGGQPVVEVGSNYANISWTTDKQSNSLVDFSPENLFSPTRPYDQTIGDPYATTLNHEVSLKGLAPDTVYHYRVISRTQTGSETKSQDFTFKTKPESNEITNYKIDKLSGEAVTFSWITSVPADSIITYIPYRNGVPVAEARQTVKESGLTTQHSLKVSGFEGGVLYDIEISGADTGNNIASKVIKGFSTEGEDSAPIISQVQTDSAIIPGDKERIQVIISWNTNELSTSRLYYRKGFALDGSGFDVSTTPDFNYTKKHIVVVTNFEPGTVYQFVAESIDSSGNVGKSNTVTILTPQKEQSVFQVILSNVESMFSWVGKIRN